jgi:hypothetical protein
MRRHDRAALRRHLGGIGLGLAITSTVGTLFGVHKHAPDGCDQTLEFDRFGIKLVA